MSGSVVRNNRRRSRRRIGTRVVLLMLSAIALVVAIPSASSADSGGVPNMVANPSVNLPDTGSTNVTIQITKADPNVNVQVFLCANIPGNYDCDNANARILTTNASGSATGILPVDYMAGIYGCDEISPSYHCYVRAFYSTGPHSGQTVDTQTMRFAGHSGVGFTANPRFELPDTGTTNLSVSGSGYLPGETVQVRQCRAGSPGAACGSGVSVVAAGDGSISTSIGVVYLINPTRPCDAGGGFSCHLQTVYLSGPQNGVLVGGNLPISFAGHSLLNSPPTASLSASPLSGDQPLLVTASGSASSPNGGTPITSYTFDWGDGSPNTGPQSDSGATHTYGNGPPRTLTLTVTNAAGVTATATKTITVNDIFPSAVLTTGIVNPSMILASGADSVTNGGTAIGSWAYNFGDGTPVVTKTTNEGVAHTYANPGTYTVTLTVKNQSLQPGVATAQVITTSPSVPPVIKVDISLNRMATDGATTVLLLDTSKSTAPGATPISYSVDWGDPPALPSTGPGPLFNHVYGTKGAKTVLITATDNAGRVATTSRVVRIYDQTQVFGLVTSQTKLKYTQPAVPATDMANSFDYTVNLTANTATFNGKGTGSTTANIPLATAKACITDHWTVSYSPNSTKTVAPQSTDWTTFGFPSSYTGMVDQQSNPSTIGTGSVTKQLTERCELNRTATTFKAGGTGLASVVAGTAPAPGISIKCVTHWQMFSVYDNGVLYKRTWSKAAPVICRH